MSGNSTDVVVIGDGVIGLSIAFELGRVGAHCRIFGASNQGAASGAAAGLLAPSVGALRPDVQAFFDASLSLYPAFVDELRRFEPELVLLEGLLDVSTEGKRSHVAHGHLDHRPEDIPSALPAIQNEARGRSLGPTDLVRLEPHLAPCDAILHQRDGAIDNGLLVRALRRAVTESSFCSVASDDPVVSIEPTFPVKLRTRGGAVVIAGMVIVAAGAWSATIAGLPRRLPVVPLKGQMLAVASVALRHPVMADEIYLVPRRAEIAIGATAEHSGFDTTVIPESIERLRQAAIRVCPALTDAPVTRRWAGIRPATPDMLPVLGPDPENSAVIYACGHSRNGILLAPATAECIAALARREQPPLDIRPFSIERFSSAEIS